MSSIGRGARGLLLLLALAGIAWSAGAPIPATPKRWVTDTVSFLSPVQLRQLEARLTAYQRQTGHEIVVWIGETLGGAPLDDWAVKTFAAWKIGRKGMDDGLILFVLAEDRQVDIEVGYGLEALVPDVIAKRIIEEVMVPKLRSKDPSVAVPAGVEAILAAIGEEPAAPGAPKPAAGKWNPILIGVAIGAFGLLFLFNPRLAIFFLMNLMTRGGGGGGGGQDGFKGGGGGRSGGGGARGSW